MKKNGKEATKRGSARPKQNVHGLDDGGRIRETQGKGTTLRRVESLDIWTCREAYHLKRKKTVVTVHTLDFRPNNLKK